VTLNTAQHTGASILGLIHLNKATSVDPLTMLMGSRAFAAVARAVLFAMVDPDDDTCRVLGQPKNNLGRSDLPTLGFRIVSAHVADTSEGPIWTGRVDWNGETERTLADLLEVAATGPEHRTATQEAAEWLADWLASQGGTDDSASIKREGGKAGHSQDSLKRARRKIGAESTAEGFPRRTYWSLPDSVRATSGESSLTTPTALTAPTDSQSEQLAQLALSDETPKGVHRL
jgi:hypothetical protein